MNRPNFNFEPRDHEWKKRDIIILYRHLKNLKGIRGIQFLKVIGFILEALKPFAELLQADRCIPSLNDYQKYEQELADLQRKHGIITDDDIIENKSYQEELRKLNKEKLPLINEYNEDWKTYNLMLDEPLFEVKLELQNIPEKIIPENIPSELYILIMPLITRD